MQNLAALDKESAEECRVQGNSQFLSKDYASAEIWYSKGLEIDMGNVVLMCNRAAAYLCQHKYESALQDAARSVEIDPSYIKAYYRKACALKELGKLTEAIEVIEAALKIDSVSLEMNDLKAEVFAEIQETQNLECSHPERMKFNRLIAWLIDGGAFFPKVHIRYYSSDYRGVHSTRAIQNKECIIYIPRSHIITLEMAKSAEIGSKMLSANLNLLSPKHSYLSSFVLSEKSKPNSFWQPYLDVLPTNYSNFPIFFSDEEKEMLAGSPFLDQVNEKIADLHQDYDSICAAVSNFQAFPFEDFCKIRMAVSSRIFGMQIDGIQTDGFVPLADMLNHSKPKQTTWAYDEKKQGFVIEALKPIPKCEEVFDGYGKKCNSRFFLNYGFILKNNDADEYPFLVRLDPNDLLFKIKKTLISGSSLLTFRLMKSVSDPIFYECLGFLRFVEAEDEIVISKLLQQYKEQEIFEPRMIKSFSVQNELRVLAKLKKIALEGINRYCETEEEDYKTLLNNELTENQRNCVMMRLGEKQILRYFIEFCEQVSPVVGKKLCEIGNFEIVEKYQEYLISSLGRIAEN